MATYNVETLQSNSSYNFRENEEIKRRPLPNIVGRKCLNLYRATHRGLASIAASNSDPLKSINRYHGLRLITMEGFLTPEQANSLSRIVSKPSVRQIVEIGFNGGHSAHTFLSNAPKNSQVVSFDLGEHRYVDRSKQFIDSMYPGRHQLVRGDSTKTVPEFSHNNPDFRADVIFIDGGHSFNEAKADLQNTRQIAHPGTVVVLDDYLPSQPWGIGPVRAWEDAVRAGDVQQMHIDSFERRAWAVGRFVGLQTI